MRPIKLSGDLATVDTTTGAVLSVRSTTDMPDAVIYKPCGNRRASACPSCAEVYRRDAFQLVRSGLVGGNGVPETVAVNPAVFATFTAPGFGVVHTRRTATDGRALTCRPRRDPQLRPHGVDMRCNRIHDPGDKVLGTPLCLDCYDHDHQVIWNFHASELWRRTTIAMRRHLHRLACTRGIDPNTVRISYGKVAEMQRRGVVHFHAIIRIDGIDPTDPDTIQPAPPGITADDLATLIDTAARRERFTTGRHPNRRRGWPITWGTQIDTDPITTTGKITDGKVAGYLAKYATKSTEATGHLSARLTGDTIDCYANPTGSHTERLIHATWTLAQPKAWRQLRAWTHMLGYGGHFLTKSRRYTTTFHVLRERRIVWQRTHTPNGEPRDATTITVGRLAYAGTGWNNTGDALLAATAAARANERRQANREYATDPTD